MDPDEIAAAISDFGGAELRRVREAVERRRDELEQSSVLERRKPRQRNPPARVPLEPQDRHAAGSVLVLLSARGWQAAQPVRGQDLRDPEALLEEKLARQDPLVKIGQTRAETIPALNLRTLRAALRAVLGLCGVIPLGRPLPAVLRAFGPLVGDPS